MTQDQFAPRELCERLQKMGCVSDSGFYWGKPDGNENTKIKGLFFFDHVAELGGCAQAFVQNDFTGATEQADANCQRVWKSWAIHKLSIIFCHDVGRGGKKEIWHEYLERTMRE